MVANADNTSKLWHQCLGHTNFGSLQHMSHLQMVEDLPQIEPPSGVCEGCILGEHHQESFLKERHVSQPLAMVHSDICGPMTTQSLGGAKYFLTFTDDFSCLTWIYIVQSKDDVFGKFKDFKLLVENQAETKIKCLRIGHGEVYTNSTFQTFLKDHRISWHETLS
jgi:hypothetical protein